MSTYLAQVYKQKYHLNSSEAAITEQFYKKGISMKLKRFSVALLMLFCVLSVIHAQEFDKKVRKEVTINGKKISKRVRYQSITEYDSNGKQIHHKHKWGVHYGESWHEYDANGNKIYTKDIENANNVEIWKDYDSNGNEIYIRTSKGDETRYTYQYDEKSNIIHCKDSTGFEYWCEYDTNGNCIHSKNSSGTERWFEYDSSGNEIYFKVFRLKYNNSHEYWYEYDAKGNKIYEKELHHNYNVDKDTFLKEIWYEYVKFKLLNVDLNAYIQ